MDKQKLIKELRENADFYRSLLCPELIEFYDNYVDYHDFEDKGILTDRIEDFADGVVEQDAEREKARQLVWDNLTELHALAYYDAVLHDADFLDKTKLSAVEIFGIIESFSSDFSWWEYESLKDSLEAGG